MTFDKKQLAAALQISQSRLEKLVATGRIPDPLPYGGSRPRWGREEIAEWVRCSCPDRETWGSMRVRHGGDTPGVRLLERRIEPVDKQSQKETEK